MFLFGILRGLDITMAWLYKMKKPTFFLCIVFGLHSFTPKGVKVGFTSEIKIKDLFCISLGLHYLYGEAVKIGVTSEIKINRFILYFARFALPLHKLNIIAYANQ